MEEIKKELIPWQRRGELGFFKALFETIKQVLFKPEKFFDNLEIKNSIFEPFCFFCLMLIPVTIFSLVWNAITKNNLFSAQTVIAIVTSFLFLPVVIFIVSAILHLFVLLFRGKGGFKGTFNVVAYSAVTSLFSLIPFIGGFIGTVWGIIVIVIGYKRIHNFSTLRAICAYFIFPFVIFITVLLVTIAVPSFSIAMRNAQLGQYLQN